MLRLKLGVISWLFFGGFDVHFASLLSFSRYFSNAAHEYSSSVHLIGRNVDGFQ